MTRSTLTLTATLNFLSSDSFDGAFSALNMRLDLLLKDGKSPGDETVCHEGNCERFNDERAQAAALTFPALLPILEPTQANQTKTLGLMDSKEFLGFVASLGSQIPSLSLLTGNFVGSEDAWKGGGGLGGRFLEFFYVYASLWGLSLSLGRLEGFPTNLRRCSKILFTDSGSTRCYPGLLRFGHFPARKTAAGKSAPPSGTLLDFLLRDRHSLLDFF